MKSRWWVLGALAYIAWYTVVWIFVPRILWPNEDNTKTTILHLASLGIGIVIGLIVLWRVRFANRSAKASSW